ncbi:PREDICTED: uncharacterized protein LOC109132850 [Camelina sativa]|uniref:Uncharacterized protein LOC109132850 n=1 Tax=Camelina sativa TaxID=90675 RepID=A0ABM1RP92_CAMSA|nr:PREDICTED: uncharacterized protein LOC109132850 [Camelina sativa]
MQRFLFGRVLEQTRHQIISRRFLTLVPSLSHPVPVPLSVATSSLPVTFDNINPKKVILGTWHSKFTIPATVNRVREIHKSSVSDNNPKSTKSPVSDTPKKPKSSVSNTPKKTKTSVSNTPKRSKFQKHHRGRFSRGIAPCENLSGSYALQTLEPGWITSRQIESGRRAMIQHIQRGQEVLVRIFADKSVTARPTEMRMGRGKGAPAFWVAVVKPGKVIYEMGGVSELIARKAIKIAATKLPLKTHFITSK